MKYFTEILWCTLVILILLVTSVFLFIKIETRNHIKKPGRETLSAYAAIVLGAGLLDDGKMSPIFKDRIDIAIELYKDKKVTTILVSGDDGRSDHNEVNPARDYLLTQGIPGSDIFLDHAGFDTYSSMYRARDVFLVGSAIIVTQSFHLPRAVFIARALGIDAYGVDADQHAYRFKNNIREVFADVKAIGDLLYNRTPKYLGKEIPITGDSETSI